MQPDYSINLQQGYGGFLTKLSYENGVINKKSLNAQGDTRIQYEINFYRFAKNTLFSKFIPQMVSFSEKSFQLEYLTDVITLENYLRDNTKHYDSNEVIVNTIARVNDILENNLYTEKVIIDIDTFKQNIFLETTGKILSRIQSIKPIIGKYDFIKTVNNVEIMNLETILEKIDLHANKYLINCEFAYYPIHGDLQLNNILINTSTNEIKFIDPRGYFGNSKIFGMKEYDLAKLYFGLGGYSYFDFKNVTELNVIDKNIVIDMKEMINIFDLPFIIQIFIISIWLGNAHCFINNELKAVESYYYSLYIATVCLNKMI
jgi:hypothetical protein